MRTELFGIQASSQFSAEVQIPKAGILPLAIYPAHVALLLYFRSQLSIASISMHPRRSFPPVCRCVSNHPLPAIFWVLLLCARVASGEYFLVSNFGDNSIHRYSLSGQDLGLFVTAPSHPYGLTLDPAGNVLVALPFQGGVIEKYSPGGADLGMFAFANGFSEHLEWDPAGNLYVSMGSQTVRKFSPQGVFLGDFVSGFNFSTGLAFDSSGRLYVSDNAPDSTGQYPIRRFSPTGVDLGTFARVPRNPEDIVFDAQGNLYSVNGGSINVFSPSGTLIRSFQNVPASDPAETSGLSIDPGGRLLATDGPNSRLRVFSLTGTLLGSFEPSGLNQPWDVLYVPEPAASSVMVFGVLTWFAVCKLWRRAAKGRNEAGSLSACVGP
jgi:sugar lactone lactonase YvrE